MHTFYFNECLPAPVNEALFSIKLMDTLREFNALYLKKIAITPAIVTIDLPSNLNLGNAYTLQSIIENLPDLILKKLAFYVFYKYPVRSFFDEDKEELLTNEYGLTLSDKAHEAVNLALAGLNDGYIFTLGLEKALCVHPLPLDIKDTSDTYVVNNLYGAEANTFAIEAIIERANAAGLNLYDRLVRLLGICMVAPQFDKEFHSLTLGEQTSILEYFEQAIARNFKTRFYPDTKIVSEVTPDKYKCSVYELRVYRPTALRVYFHEGEGIIYLASIGYKNVTFQTEDIKKAHNTIYKMMLTS